MPVLVARAGGGVTYHAVVVTGLDGNAVVCVDPATGTEFEEQIDDFRLRWELAGGGGLTICP